MNTLQDNVVRYIGSHHPALLAFWQTGGTLPAGVTIQAHCDMVYLLELCGLHDSLSFDAAAAFAQLMNGHNLPGFKPLGEDNPILVHNFAYVLGTFNLFGDRKSELYDILLDRKQINLSAIVDPKSNRPIFPSKWAHHNWRVSHWIGGIPSIILSVSRSGSRFGPEFAAIFEAVRDATDALIVPETGLLKAYRSDFIQTVFRRLYAVRHDPDLGDVGGIAHLLWIDHAIERRYVGLEFIYELSANLFRKHTPFMERVPYCLDFDIVQIVRTASEQLNRRDEKNVLRAKQMMTDIESFFESVPDTYTLHKVPGALAAWHECGMLVYPDRLYYDIIKVGHWL